MIYTSKEKLTCYAMPDESDVVRFSELESILIERPANVIYCERNGKLYGIISMGDIDRADKDGKNFVTVNKHFTSVEPGGYMCVRRIFKDNDRINALPVVNNQNELTGDYTRWDDFVAVNNFEQLKLNKYAVGFFKKKKNFALVRPCKNFEKKQRLMQAWRENLLQAGVKVSVINRDSIKDITDTIEYILFTDEDEKRGTGTLYKNILSEEFDWGKAKTYDEIGDEVLKSVISSGVHVFTLNCEDNNSDYYKRLQDDISDKYSKIEKKCGYILYEEYQREFFAELFSEEYAKEILSQNYAIMHINGISRLKDADMKTYNVTEGERKTIAQPSDFQRSIYFYGPCIIRGTYVADEHTIESFLQARLNAKGYEVKCVNYGCWADQLTTLNRVVSTEFNKGDIVILYNYNRRYEGVPSLNLVDICEKYKVPAMWMTDSPLHSNHKLNSIYADEIFEMIEPIIKENIEEKEPAEVSNDFITVGYLERYFHDFLKYRRGV